MGSGPEEAPSIMVGNTQWRQELEAAGHTASVARKRKRDRKWGGAVKPQGPPPVTHFLQ